MKKPYQVFTPRSFCVNDSIYISRKSTEDNLLSSIQETKHLILHGDSGTGKSWLYKKVFKDNHIVYMIANLANASRYDSIDREFESILNRENRKIPVSESFSFGSEEQYEGAAEASVPLITKLSVRFQKLFNRNSTKEYKIVSKEPYERVLEFLNKKSRGKRSVLVLDNLERILDKPNLLGILSNIIILLDDEKYGEYNVILLLVGIPNDLLHYFQKISGEKPVTNRLKVLSEMKPMTYDESSQLITQGFVNQLKYNISQCKKQLLDHVFWITIGIPEKIHDYCLCLAKFVEKKKVIEFPDIEQADSIWLKYSLYSNYVVISSLLNSRDTGVGRRNQVIFSIGKSSLNEIFAPEIEGIIRREFPIKTTGISINVSQILSDLSSAQNPILKRNIKNNGYNLIDPQFRMCIRVMLANIGEDIFVKSIRDI
jgi:hypothetical protein